MKNHHYLLSFLLFLSILVRLPNLDRSISKHHEFCTALALVTFDIWNDKGAAEFHYSPVTNYQNPPDLSINNGTVPFIKNGTHYYLSHPPLGFWLPYYSFKLLGLTHSNLHLQLFNLFFHLLATLCVFSLTEMLLKKGISKNIALQNQKLTPSIIAASVYLFSPAMLWYGCNVYFSDIFVNQLFVISIWAILKSKKVEYDFFQNKASKTNLSKLYINLLFVSLLVLATMLTEWIGYFLVASMGFYSLLQFIKTTHQAAKRYYALQMVSMILVGIAGMSITFFVYSDILGAEAFLQYLKQRFLTRTGQLDDNGSKISIWLFYVKQLLQHYASAYLPVLLLLIGLFFSRFLSKNQSKNNIAEGSSFLMSSFLWIALPPILLHHFLFINYTAIHEYAVVKMALPIAVLTAHLYQQHIHSLQLPSVKWLRIALLLTLLTCFVQYFYINQPGAYSWRGHRYDQFERLGLEIRQTAKADEMVFVKGDIEINFQLVYYAKRNIWRYESPEQMEATLEYFGHEKGKIYFSD